MKRRILCLSGGLDSIGALMKTLTDGSDDPLRLFHVEYQNTIAARPQKECVRRIMTHCPDVPVYIYRTEDRDMKYPIDVCTKAMLTFGSGNFLDGHLAGEHPDELEIIVGYELEEEDTTTIEELNEAIQLIRKAYVNTGIGILPTKVTSPVSQMTKHDIRDVVGHAEFWSCDTPNIKDEQTYVPCGACDTCKQMEKYGIEQHEIVPAYSTLAERWGFSWN